MRVRKICRSCGKARPVKVKTYRKSPDIHALHRVEVVDGDTIKADIALPFGCFVRKVIRLRDFWADELEGRYRSPGLDACLRLERFVEGKALWIHSPSCRMDKFGRVLGYLMHEERLISGKEVLGDRQLTEAVHIEHRATLALDRKQGRGWPEADATIKASRQASRSPTANPSAIAGVPGVFGTMSGCPCEAEDQAPEGWP